MARVVVQDRDMERCQDHASTVHAGLLPLCTASTEIRPPSPCTIGRIAERFRMQIELFSDSPVDLHATLEAARGEGLFTLADRVTIDVDPVSLM